MNECRVLTTAVYVNDKWSKCTNRVICSNAALEWTQFMRVRVDARFLKMKGEKPHLHYANFSAKGYLLHLVIMGQLIFIIKVCY